MDYSKMTVPQLQSFLKEKGTPFKSKDRKRKLIEYANETEEREKMSPSKTIRKSPSIIRKKSPIKSPKKSPIKSHSKTVRKTPSKTVRKTPLVNKKRKVEEKMSPFSQKWENKVKENNIIKTIRNGSEKYDLREFLNEGSFASVYFGTSRNTGAHYAFKEILKSKLDNRKRELVNNELKIHKDLSGHETILKFYTSFETEEAIYIVLELISGELDFYLPENIREKMDICKIWLRQLLEGLKYIHDKGYIHMDIKPENILVYRMVPDLRDVKLKIGDFGFSIPKNIKNKPKLGTPGYAAPEVLLGIDYNHTVDVWSLGCLFYFLVYGDDPFDDRKYFINVWDSVDKLIDNIKWEDRYEEANKVIRKMIANKNKRLDIPELLELPFFNI